MKFKLTLIALTFSIGLFAQEPNRNIIGPIWTFHSKNKEIIGISSGFLTNKKDRNTNTHGLRLELIGWGLLAPLMPTSPLTKHSLIHENSKTASVSEKINGFNISTLGTMGNCNINGINISPIGTYFNKVNGISINVGISTIETVNGICLGGFNMAYEINGIQVGAFNNAIELEGIQIGILENKCDNLSGFQFGLWNINQKRKFPLINWAFK